MTISYSVFSIGPDTFVATNMRQAVKHYMLEVGELTRREAIEECKKETRTHCDEFRYFDDVDDIYRDDEDREGSSRSLTEQIEQTLGKGIGMPFYLCSSEW